jgi:hypothetical protein
MNTFNKKSLYVAIAAIGAVGAGSAQAVNLSTDGLGEVLIYPYYTVNNDPNGHAYNTLLSVINTTASTKAVKMRFREGKNSREVLDFNIFLSPFDVWTAAVTPTGAGGGQISTSDNSCTIPNVQANSPVAFRNLAYAGDTAVAALDAITRTSEGYVEVFEMATYTITSHTGLNSKHTSAGVPFNCAAVTDAFATVEAQPVSGGLFGGLTIIDPAGGGAFSIDSTPLANFHPPGFARYDATGSPGLPSYQDASAISAIVSNGTFYRSTWPGGLFINGGTQAVTSILMANQIYNEYVLDQGTKSATEWILTAPTKFLHTDHVAPADAPYTHVWDVKGGTGACEPFFAIVYNREEGSPQVVNNADFSPQPGPAPGIVMCWESNLVAYQTTGTTAQNLFGSANRYVLNTPFTNGWAVIAYNDPTPLVPAVHSVLNTNTVSTILATGAAGPTTVTYSGLPVVGFAAETFNNNALTINGVTYLSTFGATYAHRLQTMVQ